MDFSLSTEHEQLRDLIRRFCQTEIAPLVQQAEETETFPVEIFRKWGDLGLFGIRYPEADGGSGMDKVADCIVREEISAVAQSFATAWSAHSHLALWPLWRAGTPGPEGRLLQAGTCRPQDRRLRAERARHRLQHPRADHQGDQGSRRLPPAR